MKCLEFLAWVVLMATSLPVYGGPNDENAAARAASDKGTAAYNLGHFDEAALPYLAAFDPDRDPNMLFNAAQSIHLGGRHGMECVGVK